MPRSAPGFNALLRRLSVIMLSGNIKLCMLVVDVSEDEQALFKCRLYAIHCKCRLHVS